MYASELFDMDYKTFDKKIESMTRSDLITALSYAHGFITQYKISMKHRTKKE